MRYITSSNRGVSQVVGFILTFALVSVVTTSAVYTTSTLVENRSKFASELIAQDVVNYVINAILECSATIETFPNANYSKNIEIPSTIGTREYNLKATNTKVFLNTTGGYIKENSTTYKQEELCAGISGNVHSRYGEVTVRSNRTGNSYEIEIGRFTWIKKHSFMYLKQSL